MNGYDNLLMVLLEADKQSLQIKINTSTSAVRKGLRKAIASLDEQNSILGLPEIDKSVSVTEPNDDGIVTITLVDESAVNQNRFKPKFDFKIVGTDDDSQEN